MNHCIKSAIKLPIKISCSNIKNKICNFFDHAPQLRKLQNTFKKRIIMIKQPNIKRLSQRAKAGTTAGPLCGASGSHSHQYHTQRNL